MKIVIYYPENLTKLSGTPFRILRMAEFLANAGHEVTVVGTNIKEDDCNGFTFRALPIKNKLRYINTRAVKKIIKDIKPDLWYSFTEASLPSAVNPCKKYNITHIIELHDHYLYEAFFKRGFKAKESGLLFKVLNNKVINYLAKADCIIVLTDALKEYYLPKVKRIECMYPGADKRMFDAKFKPLKELQELKKKFTILTYAGNFNKYQGGDLLFEVIKELKERKVSGFKFLLMGGDLSKYQALIDEEQLQDLIHFVGKPPLKDTSLYLTATDFFIIPKVDWHGSKYLFASKYCDYVMFHKPIISTNIGEAALKLVKENGMLVPPNKEALVDAILKIKDTKWKNKVTKAALKMNTAPFTIEDNIKQFEKIVKELKNEK